MENQTYMSRLSSSIFLLLYFVPLFVYMSLPRNNNKKEDQDYVLSLGTCYPLLLLAKIGNATVCRTERRKTKRGKEMRHLSMCDKKTGGGGDRADSSSIKQFDLNY
jgi:hypothetical protein